MSVNSPSTRQFNNLTYKQHIYDRGKYPQVIRRKPHKIFNRHWMKVIIHFRSCSLYPSSFHQMAIVVVVVGPTQFNLICFDCCCCCLLSSVFVGRWWLVIDRMCGNRINMVGGIMENNDFSLILYHFFSVVVVSFTQVKTIKFLSTSKNNKISCWKVKEVERLCDDQMWYGWMLKFKRRDK